MSEFGTRPVPGGSPSKLLELSARRRTGDSLAVRWLTRASALRRLRMDVTGRTEVVPLRLRRYPFSSFPVLNSERYCGFRMTNLKLASPVRVERFLRPLKMLGRGRFGSESMSRLLHYVTSGPGLTLLWSSIHSGQCRVGTDPPVASSLGWHSMDRGVEAADLSRHRQSRIMSPTPALWS